MDEDTLYLTQFHEHLSATFIGDPDSYQPSYHPPTGYWTSAEKALFFRALSTHSRFRPDLIASSIRTKSILDVIVYLGLLRDGARGLAASRGAIARDQLPAAHQVSPALIALEDAHAERLAAAEPARTDETCAAARKEAARAMRNSMRVKKGEGGRGVARDREGQQARRDEFESWREEKEGEWAREDTLARLDDVALQVLDRIQRADEDKREMSPLPELPVAGPSTCRRATSPPTSKRPRSPILRERGNDCEDLDSILANLSPASRKRARKRLYMRRKRAEASGGLAQLNPIRLKPGRKTSMRSKSRQRRTSVSEPNDDTDDDGDRDEDAEKEHKKPLVHGLTRPYKVQRKLDELGIGAEYMRQNGLGLFRLGALWRLMRLYPRLDPLRPEGITGSISAGTIQTLYTLVVRFTRDIVRRALALRELDFARRGTMKMWRLGKRLVRPQHVRRALQLRGAYPSKHAYFEELLARFSEGEEESEEEVPLALLMQNQKAAARSSPPVSDKEEKDGDDRSVDDGVWTDEDEESGCTTQVLRSPLLMQNQKAAARSSPPPISDEEKDGDGRSVDDGVWTNEDEESGRTTQVARDRETYAPFIYAPGLAPAYPFGVYAPGTVPEPLGTITEGVRLRPATAPYDDDAGSEDDAEDLMPDSTDDEALKVELAGEALLDAADARAAAAYEAAVWSGLRAAPRAQKRRSTRKRTAPGDDVEGEDPRPVQLRKRRKTARAGSADALLRSPGGVDVKSAPMVEDSDSDSEYADSE